MMIFNSFIAVNDFNFGTQITGWLSCFLANKRKLFEGICLALVGTFLQKSCEFFLYTKPFCEKPITTN